MGGVAHRRGLRMVCTCLLGALSSVLVQRSVVFHHKKVLKFQKLRFVLFCFTLPKKKEKKKKEKIGKIGIMMCGKWKKKNNRYSASQN